MADASVHEMGKALENTFLESATSAEQGFLEPTSLPTYQRADWRKLTNIWYLVGKIVSCKCNSPAKTGKLALLLLWKIRGAAMTQEP